MKIAVIGTGGVGGYFGGKMAHAGYDVTFLARGEHLKAIRQKGLRIKSIHGDALIPSPKVTDQISDVGDPDLVLIGTKAWQVKEVARSLRPVINEFTTILPLQNGIMAYDEIADEIGRQHALGGLCRIFSKIESPGVIVHLGMEPAIVFGEMDGTKSDRAQKIGEVFDKSGIKNRIAEDIRADLWKKFIGICVSGLLAVARSTYGEIRGLRETRDLMIELMEEVYAISQKIGVKIDHEFIPKSVAFVDTFSFDATSSLTRDVWDGKPSEIEYQNGTVVRLGEKYGVSTPVNRFIYNCILPMENRARKNYTNQL